jgi:hypothetical protein
VLAVTCRFTIGSPYLYLDSNSNTGTSRIYFGDADSDIIGSIFYGHTSDDLVITTGASERLSLSGTEAVFNDVGFDVDFRVESDTNTHALFVQGSSGNVGIGTALPSRKLSVEGTGVIFNNTGGEHNVLFGDAAYRYFNLYTPASPQYMSIRTASTDLLTVKYDGNVGIGTTSPSTTLHLSSAGTALRLQDTDTNAYAEISTSDQGSLVLEADKGNSVASSVMLFKVDATERMQIDSSGRVAIGDTPKASFTGHSILQVGGQAILGANDALSTTGQTYLTHNIYYDISGTPQVFNTSTSNEGTVYAQVDGIS